jgi:hypothetical protein
MISFAFLATALATTPPGIVALDHVQRFTLVEPAVFWWNADRETFSKGTLFVVQVQSEWALTLQVGGHVLYVGDTPAARLNPGHIDGHIVAYVPQWVDLKTVPIFWGPATLPEQVKPKLAGTANLNAATAPPFSHQDVDIAMEPQREFQTHKDLELAAALLIEAHAPSDRDFAIGYRAGSQ